MRNLRNSYANWCLAMKERRFQCMFFLKLGGEKRRKHRDGFRTLETDRRRKVTLNRSYSNYSMMKMLILWIITIIIAQSTVKAEEDLELTFDAKQVIEMKLKSRLKASAQDAKITLLFKTIQPSGIVFLVNGLNGDFIFMEMVRGKMRIVLGTRIKASQIVHEDILLEDNLCDNEWHQLELHILQDVTHARVDSWNGYTSRTTKRLQIDRNIILGGQDRDHLSDISVSKRNYTGCLSYVVFNDIYVLRRLRKQHSDLKWTCLETEKNDLINFDQPSSNVQFSNAITSDINLGLWFRTYHRDGVLITNMATDSLNLQDTRRLAKFMLYFQNNKLKLRLNGKIVITMNPQDNIDFGSWHRIKLLIVNGTVRLHLDKDVKVYSFKRSSFLDFGTIVSVANRVENVPNFMGWIRNLTMNNKKLTYLNATKIKDVSIGIYRMKDLCYPNPCNNTGVCIQNENGSKCDCTNTGYTGDRCSKKIIDYKRTCEEYYKNGKTKSGEYFIKPGVEAFKVFCDMDHTGGPVTRVIHNRKNQRKAIYESTSSDSRFYYHEFNYRVAMDQLTRLIEISERCQQYVEYYCSKSTLMFSTNKLAALLNRYGARWYSRDGNIQSYWGGASKNSFKCACGMNNSCADSRLACNCDAMDGSWKSDGGFLRYKDDLPVTKLQFSKRNTNPAAMYMLGALECFGNQTEAKERSRKSSTTETPGIKPTNQNIFTTGNKQVTSTLLASTAKLAKTTQITSSTKRPSTVKYTTTRPTDTSPLQTYKVSSNGMLSSIPSTTMKRSTLGHKTDRSTSLPTLISSFGIARDGKKPLSITPTQAFAKTGGSLSAEIAVTKRTVTRKTASVLVVHQPAKQSESVLSNKQMFILVALISSLTLFTILLIVVVLRQRIFSNSSKKLTVELKQDIENPNKYAFQLPNNNTGSFSDSSSQSRSMQDMNKIEIVRVGSIFRKQLPSESESSVNSFDASRYLEVGEESDSGSYTSFTKPKSILKANKFLLTSRPRSEGDQFDMKEPGEVIGLIHVKAKQKSPDCDENSELLAGTTSSETSNITYHMQTTKNHSSEFYQGNAIEHIGCGRNESIDADTGFITDSSLSSNSRKSLSSSGSDESNEEFFMRKNRRSTQRSKRSVRFSLNELKTDLKTQPCVQDKLYQECDDEVFS